MTPILLWSCLALLAPMQVEEMQAEADQKALIERIKKNQRAVDEMLLEASEVDVVKQEIETARQLHLV